MLTWSRCRQILRVLAPIHSKVRSKSIEASQQLITKHLFVEKSHKRKALQFVDYRCMTVKGGDGGDGAMSFLSVFANEFAGPDGGDGGNGGHVMFQADSNESSLQDLKSIVNAESGGKGMGKNRNGKNAKHTILKVPIGTTLKDENFRFLADLCKHGDMFIGGRGGAGGKGNRFFCSAENTAPTVYEEGGKGHERKLHVELRVIAHVGLVGFPNAGKSTLLRALSRARPRVAAYPFTTLRPHIGIIEYEDCQQVAVADIPGLVPGAHENHGLGISFLRHIERCLCLLYVVDLSDPDPVGQLQCLQHELEYYQTGLSLRPHAVVANKMDLPMAAENLNKLTAIIGELMIFPISAKHKTDIDALLKHIRVLYDEHDNK